ncbi:MAG: ATP-binding protein [Kiritimatiellae bacterium]|nr:ATP-binding protein [Kiritimatiellia bacterium]
MEFIHRNKEIAKLRSIRDRSRNGPCWPILTGRRRIGKTSLVMNELRNVVKRDAKRINLKTSVDFCSSRKERKERIGMAQKANCCLRWCIYPSTQMVKRRFHSFLLTDIHLCDLCVLCGKKYRGGEVSTEEYRINLDLLAKKSEAFFTKNPGLRARKASYRGLSLADM